MRKLDKRDILLSQLIFSNIAELSAFSKSFKYILAPICCEPRNYLSSAASSLVHLIINGKSSRIQKNTQEDVDTQF